MLSLVLLGLFVALLCLYFRKAAKPEETLISVNEYRDYPFAIEWSVNRKTRRGTRWSEWRHVTGCRSEKERTAKLAAMRVNPQHCRVRLVNYRRKYPNSG